MGIVGIVAPFAPRGFSIRGKFVLSIGQAKSSIPALSYFQVGGMKHDQELYAKGALCGSTLLCIKLINENTYSSLNAIVEGRVCKKKNP